MREITNAKNAGSGEKMNEVKDAIEVIKKATANCAVGTRAIVVLERGWIFAGNLSYDEKTDVSTITDCCNIRKWKTGGFGLLTKNATAAGAELDKCEPIKYKGNPIFVCPIDEAWDV